MKKHNEGYTLPLVLVVMIIMCLIAVSVMSVALHNLQAQKTSITRMQDKYEAQGELEKKIAALGLVSSTENLQLENAKEAAKNLVEPILGINIKPGDWSEGEDGYHCTVTFSVENQKENVTVSCTLRLENLVVKGSDGSYYKVSAPNVVYTSYEIGGAG